MRSPYITSSVREEHQQPYLARSHLDLPCPSFLPGWRGKSSLPRNIAAAEVGISFHQIACSSLVVTDSNDSAWNVLHYQVKATLISGCTLCQCVGRGRCGLRSRGPHMSYTLPRYGNDILPCRESSSNMLKDWPLPSHAAGRPWHLYSILRTRRATPSFGGSLRRECGSFDLTRSRRRGCQSMTTTICFTALCGP
jgi:hypothetical protein